MWLRTLLQGQKQHLLLDIIAANDRTPLTLPCPSVMDCWGRPFPKLEACRCHSWAYVCLGYFVHAWLLRQARNLVTKAHAIAIYWLDVKACRSSASAALHDGR
jgi:hypothetical protein